jgi:hypothetical protein
MLANLINLKVFTTSSSQQAEKLELGFASVTRMRPLNVIYFFVWNNQETLVRLVVFISQIVFQKNYTLA